MSSATYDAVVLAGGAARRMNGCDKTRLLVGAATLLDRALTATVGAARTVVVGDERPVTRPVEWTRESPAGAGPVAALAAGLGLVTAPVVVVLAADMPFVSAGVVDRLLAPLAARAAASEPCDGAVLVDGDGREQWLCGAWRSDVLRARPLPAGGSLRQALGPLRFARVPDPGDGLPAWLDCDTPVDLDRAEQLLVHPQPAADDPRRSARR
ncbi:MAG TPA: NTP transferase domain-containing protein [Mycobacteriales bacterium]|nr:NTP transferase domain-containing protein [Mycobacteriales bacterium]